MYPITLDKERHFRYGMRAAMLIERQLKKKLSEIGDNPSFTDIAVMMWAGLVHEDNSLSLEKVVGLIDKHSNVAEASEVMLKAWADFTDPKDSASKKNEEQTGESLFPSATP